MVVNAASEHFYLSEKFQILYPSISYHRMCKPHNHLSVIIADWRVLIKKLSKLWQKRDRNYRLRVQKSNTVTQLLPLAWMVSHPHSVKIPWGHQNYINRAHLHSLFATIHSPHEQIETRPSGYPEIYQASPWLNAGINIASECYIIDCNAPIADRGEQYITS